MSTGIGAIQGRKWGPGFAPTVAFAAIVAITTAAIITSVGPDTDERTGTREPPASVVSGTAANTPTEIRGGMAQSPATTVRAVPHVPRRAGDARVASFVGGTAANTPTEMTGGIVWPTVWPRTADAIAAFDAAERYDRHQRV